MATKIDRIYFHELPTSEQDRLLNGGTTWQKLQEDYAQPHWCDEPFALSKSGCYSLLYGMVSNENYCKTCESYSEVLKGGD